MDAQTLDRISRARVAGKPLRIAVDQGPAPRRDRAERPARDHAPAGRRPAREERYETRPKRQRTFS